jgi:tRNA-dihydrouridine synthase
MIFEKGSGSALLDRTTKLESMLKAMVSVRILKRKKKLLFLPSKLT